MIYKPLAPRHIDALGPLHADSEEPEKTMNFSLARRAHRMNPSVIREILKITERPGMISFAGGLPSPDTFPVEAMRAACERVLVDHGQAALQYASSEGHGPLREWVAQSLVQQGMRVGADQVLITTGSQQGLDLVAKVFLDAGSRVLVETPTYLGALQAFTPMEPEVEGLESDEEGALPQALQARADGARMAYLLPNFQNPTGRTMSPGRRDAVAEVAARKGLPLVEDNPYGDLWFDQAPPASLASRYPEGTVYLGSFSKILAPGLRLGYVVAPRSVYPKLLQAKQAADLHSPSFNQRVVAEVIRDGFIERHIPTIRARYKAQCEGMLAALEKAFPHSGSANDASLSWNRPSGGMFIWARLAEPLRASELLPLAVEQGVAFVPGSAFYPQNPDLQSLRLSFVTPSLTQIKAGIPALARAIHAAHEKSKALPA